MKVFIDCGAFRGKIIKRFNDARPGYKIYAFECNPTLSGFDYGPEVTTIRKAIWTADETISFYLSKANKDKVEGSTVFKQKTTGNIDRDNPVHVQALDFGRWMRCNFSISDYVVVKMNVEGAEYDVIPKMIQDGSIKLINELHIQWHYQKIFFPIESHREIVAALKATGIGYFHGYEKLYTGPEK